MKPNNKSTLKEIKQYIRDNKLNKAPIKLTMNKPELVKKLKELGHYEEVKSKPKPKSKPKAKPKPKPKPKKKKASGNTTAGQLLDLPLDISDKIGKAVKEQKLDYYEITSRTGTFEADDQITDMVKRFKPDKSRWLDGVSGGNAGYTAILTKAKAKIIKKKYPLLTIKAMGAL